MKSVDQQGGERVTVTYHVPPPYLSLTLALICGGITLGKHLQICMHAQSHTRSFRYVLNYPIKK